MDFKLATKVDSTVPEERWIASLSNGLTVHENVIKGDLPAWERLCAYCEQEGLSITNLRLLIAGIEIKLPANQDGYIQKKIAWSTVKQSGVRKCIGYAQGGLSLIQEVSSDKDSLCIRGKDPGAPWTFYKKEIRDAKNV